MSMYQPMIQDRRLRKVGVHFDLLREMIEKGYKSGGLITCDEGIPPDAVLVNSYYDAQSHAGYLIFYHPGFDVVDVGSIIPEQMVRHSISYL